MSDIIDGWYYSLVDTPSPLTQEEKENFRKICQEQEENMQRVVRSFIKAYIEKFDNN